MYMCVCMYMCMCVCVYMCMCIYMVCMCMYMCVCMYMCMCVHVYVYIHGVYVYVVCTYVCDAVMCTCCCDTLLGSGAASRRETVPSLGERSRRLGRGWSLDPLLFRQPHLFPQRPHLPTSSPSPRPFLPLPSVPCVPHGLHGPASNANVPLRGPGSKVRDAAERGRGLVRPSPSPSHAP